jgi:hypothetical protein
MVTHLSSLEIGGRDSAMLSSRLVAEERATTRATPRGDSNRLRRAFRFLVHDRGERARPAPRKKMSTTDEDSGFSFRCS